MTHSGVAARHIFRLLAVALAASPLLGCDPPSPPEAANTTSSERRECDPPSVVAHRGSAGTSPENTVASIGDAQTSGAAAVEVDVQLSADGVPFLFHDETGLRTTDVAAVFPDRASEPIVDFTWAQLQELDAGSYFSQRFTGEGIPHLNDAARSLSEGQMSINLELKSPADSPGVEEVVAQELATDDDWQRLIADGAVVVSSFDEAALNTFGALAPDIPLLQIGTIPEDDETLQRWAGFADGVVTNYRSLNPADIERVRANDLDLGLYTLNSTEAIESVAALCADTVITDFPSPMVHLFLGDDPYPEANGIVVSTVAANPLGDDLRAEDGEHVTLTNTSASTIDVSGYLLQDAGINRLTIGDGYSLAPDHELHVYTGPGTNSGDRYYNGGTVEVLDNNGDSIAVLNPELDVLHVYAY